MILETYQEQQAIVAAGPARPVLRHGGYCIRGRHRVIFNGAETESLKHYKCNTAVRFAAGQRVRIIEDSGTYVVEYPVGAPAQSIYADSAARAAYASEAGYAESAGKAATATKADTAASAGSADTAKSAETAETAKTAKSAETAAQAENAAAAETAKNADFATRAGQVDNLAETMRTLCFPTAPRELCLSGLQGTANGPNSPAPLSNQFLGGSYGYFD